MTYSELEKTYLNELLVLYSEEETKALAHYAITHVCKISKTELLLNKNNTLSAMDETSLLMMLSELKLGQPIQYITGETEFFGLRYKVNPSVLIPRPETEELVKWVLEEVKSLEFGVWSLEPEGRNVLPFNILDIGTGSGCIPISLKKHLAEASVYAMDISPAALETAIANAVLNQAEVKFIQADILAQPINPQPLTFNLLPSTLNLIVSNPPYITISEKEHMHQNVLAHEPEIALFVPDTDPLVFYDRIADFALKYLEMNGLLFFEINENLGKETVKLLKDKGFEDVVLRPDLMGKDRMIKARRYRN